MKLTKAAPGKKGDTSTGPPDEPLEGGWLPVGWVQKRVKRQNGASKGCYDPYWYSPVKQYKFRSKKDVKRFLSCMRMVGGDEVRAYKMFKGGIKTHFTMNNPNEKHLDSKKTPQDLNQNSGGGAQVTERLQTQSGTEKAGAPIAHCTSKINVVWNDYNAEDIGDDDVGAVNQKDLAGKQAEKDKLQEKKAKDADSKSSTDDGDEHVENEKVGEKKQAEKEMQQEKKSEGETNATKNSKPGADEGGEDEKVGEKKHTDKDMQQEKKTEDDHHAKDSKTGTDNGDEGAVNEKDGKHKKAEEKKQQEKKTEGDNHARDSKPGTFGKYIPLQAHDEDEDEDEYTSTVEYKSKAPVRVKDVKPCAYKKKGNDDELEKDKFEQSNDDDDASEEYEENHDESEEEDNDSEYEEEEEDMEEGFDKTRHKDSKRAPSPTTQLGNYVLNRKGQPTSDDEESKDGNVLPQGTPASTIKQGPRQSITTTISMAPKKVTEQEPCNPSVRNNTKSPDSASRKRPAEAVDSTGGPSTNIIQALLSTKTTQSEKNAVLATYDTWKASKATLQTCQKQVSQAEKALIVARKLHDEQKEAHRMASEVMNALIQDNLHPDGRSKRQKRFMPPK